MWLLNTSTFLLEFFENTDTTPYATLSHTWGEQELTYQEINHLHPSTRLKSGFQKVESFCRLARDTYKLRYAWVDTCCINKESSAELTEAINSMYKWYRDAAICLVYLVDVPDVVSANTSSIREQINRFKSSRWFTRGWTLQELIACTHRVFYTQTWQEVNAAKHWEWDMIETISTITNIDVAILRNSSELRRSCSATRMSWVAHRETTRPEDMAYCLMGLFNISMPILYGEGLRSAFRRLQDEIMKTSFDQTLFAWRNNYASSGLLAHCPQDFANTPELGLWAPNILAPTVSTNIGTLFAPCVPEKVAPDTRDGVIKIALQCDIKTDTGWMVLLLYLKRIRDADCFVNGKVRKVFRRIDCDHWDVVPNDLMGAGKFVEILVLEDENYDLVKTSIAHHDARWESGQMAVS